MSVRPYGNGNGTEWRKKNEAAISFWWYSKDNTKSSCFYKNPDRDLESVAVLFMGKEEN